MGRALVFLLIAALLLCPSAAGGIDRVDTVVLLDTARLEYHSLVSFSGREATNERRPFDADASNSNNASEAAAYEANATSSRLGQPTAILQWDGEPTNWSTVAATTLNFANKAITANFDLNLDGVLALTSGPALSHTLTIFNLSRYSSYSFALSLPANWTIISVSGVATTNQTNTSVAGSIDPSGTGVIQVAEPFPNEDLVAPVLNAGAAGSITAGTVAAFNGTAADNDPIFPVGASFWWTFVYNGTPYNFSGLEFNFTFWVAGPQAITFWGRDRSGNVGEAAVNVTVVPPDLSAPLVDAGPDLEVAAGELVTLNGIATDDDPAFPTGAQAGWTFQDGGSNVTLSGAQASYTFNTSGHIVVTFWVRDAWGNTGSDTRVVTVRPSSAGTTVMILASVGVVLVAGLILTGLMVTRRRSPGAPASQGSPPAAAAPGVASARGPAVPPPAPVPTGPTYVLEGLMVLYRDGRLIHHLAGSPEAHLDNPDVMGSMFSAVADFIKDSLSGSAGDEGALSRLTYGKNTIVLERGAHLVVAGICYGEPDVELREKLRDTTGRLESAYAGVVENWSGDRAAFTGIEELLTPLFAATQALTRADVRDAEGGHGVRLLSATEHFKGYIRLKVSFVNATDDAVKDIAVEVDFNRDALVLARVEPTSLPRDGAAVVIGTAGPGERIGVVYYLDPQVCALTDITGRALYRDGAGEKHEVAMKTRQAEIVCPVFFTPEHANAAMLKRLVDSALKARDSKVYDFAAAPTRSTYQALFKYASETVMQYDLRTVRSLTSPSPFNGRAWFYGLQKVAKTPVVIRLQVSEEKRRVEFLVAAEEATAVTGLLAELNRSFLVTLRARLPRLKFKPVLDESLKGSLTPDEFVAADGKAGPI